MYALEVKELITCLANHPVSCQFLGQFPSYPKLLVDEA